MCNYIRKDAFGHEEQFDNAIDSIKDMDFLEGAELFIDEAIHELEGLAPGCTTTFGRGDDQISITKIE